MSKSYWKLLRSSFELFENKFNYIVLWKRHCATGGRLLHWLGYRDRNGLPVSEVENNSSENVCFCHFCVCWCSFSWFSRYPRLVWYKYVFASYPCCSDPLIRMLIRSYSAGTLHPCEQQWKPFNQRLATEAAKCKERWPMSGRLPWLGGAHGVVGRNHHNC